MLRVYCRNFLKFIRIPEKGIIGTGFQSFFSTNSNEDIPIATYEEILELKNHPEKTLIDVREPQELIDTGVIPCSINIPRDNKKNNVQKLNFII